MVKRLLFCEACGHTTEHDIDGADEECGELALCTRCGRLSSRPAETGEPAPAASDEPRPCDSRTR